MMNFNEKEVEEIATLYAKYYYSVITELNETPMSFSEFCYMRNLKSVKESNKEILIDEVIHYLNYHCKLYGKRGFMKKGKKIRSLIRTKLKEGFTLEDFKKVIEVKLSWLEDDSMSKYYRPITLFGNKFEDYLNENVKPLQQTKKDGFTEAINRAATDTY